MTDRTAYFPALDGLRAVAVLSVFLLQHHYLGGHVHTWSLAVEEQFYLVLPIALVLVLRRRFGGQVMAVGVTSARVGRS